MNIYAKINIFSALVYKRTVEFWLDTWIFYSFCKRLLRSCGGINTSNLAASTKSKSYNGKNLLKQMRV